MRILVSLFQKAEDSDRIKQSKKVQPSFNYIMYRYSTVRVQDEKSNIIFGTERMKMMCGDPRLYVHLF